MPRHVILKAEDGSYVVVDTSTGAREVIDAPYVVGTAGQCRTRIDIEDGEELTSRHRYTPNS